jgi:YD repeat-containing protein
MALISFWTRTTSGGSLPRMSTRRIALLFIIGGVWALATAPQASAVTCPSTNPVVQENNCAGPGATDWRLNNGNENIGGFSTQTSVNKGTSVALKIGRNVPTLPAGRVDIRVYRAGNYGGEGARLISAAGATNVLVNNTFACNPMDATTGKLDCGNWSTTYTVPGSALTTSGVYFAKITTTDTGEDNWIIFVVRDDARASQVLFVLPTASYAAYNNWGGKSLYFDKEGGANTVAKNGRAVKVSFNRPIDRPEATRDRFFGPDIDLIAWYERQGYDVAYTDDVSVTQTPSQLNQHKIVAWGAHSEYWSAAEMQGAKTARDAGVNLMTLGANSSYWRVRYEDSSRTLVCYKTVQGTGSSGAGSDGVNDWGPDGLQGTADDVLGPNGVVGGGDDHPENATTTWRDNGAPAGDPGAPAGGRIGPNQPENSLWGVMYVGDNDDGAYPLTIPASNASAEYSGDRFWRNTGISQNVATTIGTDVVGWEWDAVPSQAQYLAQQPTGVKRLSNSTTTAQTPNWLQDEGWAYAGTPPPGQPGTVNAAKYRAASGAWVFATGTNQWSQGLGDDRVAQATYNIMADMGVQPLTPDGITPDPAGSNTPPTASFTATPTTATFSQAVQFNASASSDANGTITNYQWDLDGNGTFETNTGTVKTTSRTYSSEGTIDVRLLVTDNGGATDLTVRTITILNNAPPVAAFTVTPNPAVSGQNVAFNASTSTDSDGTITKYEWDFDGNGTYETNAAASATTSHAFAATGTVQVGLRVTDNGGKTATTTMPVTINSGGFSNYGDAVLDTPGLVNYWRLGESAGPSFADSKGTATGTASTGVTFHVPGAVAADPNTAVRFNGTSSAANAPVNLSGTSKVTVEFWLNWAAYADNDNLAMELTQNFNDTNGGFLVDPNAPQFGGTFGVAMGRDASRNSVFFPRPSAGQWHHYALVLDATAPAATQITPYVDGQAVAYQKNNSGTGAGAFANAVLNLMSRAGTSLRGQGDLDEVAVYDRPLTATQIGDHFQSYGANRRPVAAFTLTPNPAPVGATVTFNASTSTDPDGTITKYEWDLDGNGSYEVSSASPTTTRSYATGADIDVKLRVTDDKFGSDTEVHALHVGDQAPVATFTAAPNPAVIDQAVTFNAAGSSDDGTITKYEWDLDGNGTFETDRGSATTATKLYSATGTVQVTLRVTDNGGKTATKTLPVTVNASGTSNYGDAVLDTTGLLSYWRLGETTGPSFADSKGTNTGTALGATTFGVTGAVAGDTNKAMGFDGTSGAGRVHVNLSGTSTVTVEFWLNWKRYATDDALAMEFTDNFNNAPGGFLIDPNAPQSGGTFGVGFGDGASRNTAYFARPTGNVWHHYAIVFDATAPGATAITPYVDGQPIAYTKGSSGTGAGAFKDANLYLMSRAATALFGQGDMDEVAVYNRALSAATIAEHYTSNGVNRRPVAAFTATPNPVKAGSTVTFNGAGSSDPDGTITKYQWDLDGNGSYETDTGSNPQTTKVYASASTVDVRLRVTDNGGGTDTEVKTVTVGNSPPTAAFTATPNPANVGQAVAFNAAGTTDVDGTIAKYEWDLDGNGSYETDTGTTAQTSKSYAAAGNVNVGLKVTDDDGLTNTVAHSVSVHGASYDQTVLGTSGLVDYWRLDEASGTTLADSKGGRTATLTGGTLGVTGALAGSSSTAVRFNGNSESATASVDLSGTQAVTLEFWLKWQPFVNDDDLAMELTSNFNDNAGGVLVDPNASTGNFGVGIGSGASRNNVYFARPSSGAWHHYTLVLNSAAPAATQITPYVDGQPVAYTKSDSGTGAGPFANASLYFMSRAGQALFGGGDLDELAVYSRALAATEVAAHYVDGT